MSDRHSICSGWQEKTPPGQFKIKTQEKKLNFFEEICKVEEQTPNWWLTDFFVCDYAYQGSYCYFARDKKSLLYWGNYQWNYRAVLIWNLQVYLECQRVRKCSGIRTKHTFVDVLTYIHTHTHTHKCTHTGTQRRSVQCISTDLLFCKWMLTWRKKPKEFTEHEDAELLPLKAPVALSSIKEDPELDWDYI